VIIRPAERCNQQVSEVWTGATSSVAALMLSDGMKDEAFPTAWGVYHVVCETKGYWFRTPEAYDVKGTFRASMYMRPAGIWAVEISAPAKREVAQVGITFDDVTLAKGS